MKQPQVSVLDILPMLTVVLHQEGHPNAFVLVAALFFVGRSVGAVIQVAQIIQVYALNWSERCIIAGWMMPAAVLLLVVSLTGKLGA